MSDQDKHKRRKIRVRVGQPPPPPAVIERYQNFQGLVTDYQDLTQRLYRKPLYKNPRMFLAVVLIAVIAYLVFRAVEEERAMEIMEQNRTSLSIQPPIPHLDPPFETYSINGKKGGSFVHFTGTEISFSPDAFLLENGKIWPNEVKIRYRELLNPTDFFLSGTHLLADSAAPKKLEVASLMEIQALCGNVSCKLKLAHPATVKLAKAQRAPEGEDFQVYRMDTGSGYWGGEFRSVETLAPPDPLGEPLKSPRILPRKPRVMEEDACHFILYVKDGSSVNEKWLDVTWEQARFGSLNSPCRVKEFETRLWDDISVVRVAGTGEYLLTFWRGPDPKLEVRAHPVIHESEMEEALFSYREELRAYLALPGLDGPYNLREQGGFALRLSTLGTWTVARPAPERDERLVPVRIKSDRCDPCEPVLGLNLIRKGENSIERFFPDEEGLFHLPQGSDGDKLMVGVTEDTHVLFMHPSYFAQLSEWDGEETLTVTVKTLAPAWRFPEEVHRILRLR